MASGPALQLSRRSRLAVIRQPDVHTIGPACERSRLAATRQVMASGLRQCWSDPYRHGITHGTGARIRAW